MVKVKTHSDCVEKFLLLHGDAKSMLSKFPDNTFHTAVTSPPYWKQRDYFAKGQLGQEATPEEFIENLVDICKEVKRVLRKDGTFWLNIGDSYNTSSGFCRGTKGWKRKGRDKGSADKKAIKHPYVKKKELFGVPWMLAISLQKDGWYLRCDIIWEKSNPMPDGAKDRPTRGHEYLFLLSKSPQYFYDYYRVLEDTEEKPDGVQSFGARNQKGTYRMDQERSFQHYGKRNKRSVWTTSVSSFQGDHFATYPPQLIEPCIMASTSEYGCCVKCGTPWSRQFEKVEVGVDPKMDKGLKKRKSESVNYFEDECPTIEEEKETEYSLELVSKGWEKGCKCKTDEVTSCLVLDPFSGTGTTGEVALKHGQRYVGIELNKKYIEISRERLHPTSVRKEVETIEDILDG